MITCLNCNKREATKHEVFGYLPCKVCLKKQKRYRVADTIELTTADIKEDRKKFQADILQRYRGDTPSKEYIDKYGTKGFTQEELRRKKNVWTEDSYYNKD